MRSSVGIPLLPFDSKVENEESYAWERQCGVSGKGEQTPAARWPLSCDGRDQSSMKWLKQLFASALTIDDPMFGTMTLDKGYWLALPSANRKHMVILAGNAKGPSEQQRSRYAGIVQAIDHVTDQSIAYLRSQPEYAESLEAAKLELYAVIITNASVGEELDFTLEFSLDGEAIYGVTFVADRATNCYLDH